MSETRKTVVVLGATGQQVSSPHAIDSASMSNVLLLKGGSIVNHFLQQSTNYHVRGLTRDVNSVKAKELAQKGVEVISADLNDITTLVHAFKGAHVIYAMTDFWQAMSFDIEYNQGVGIADTAADLPQLEHFIWATLPDGRALSNGKFTHIYHWQSKAAVTDYIRKSRPALWAKTTAVLFPNYFENCKTAPTSYLPVKVSDSTRRLDSKIRG